MRRLSLLSLLISLVVCPITLSQAHKPATAPCAASKLPYTPGELQDLYKTYNRMYWDGKLPAANVIWTGLSKKFAETDMGADGDFIIKLDVLKNHEQNDVKITMLHEMAHIKTWGDMCHVTGHPDQCARWLAEIHRIMLEGAFDDII